MKYLAHVYNCANPFYAIMSIRHFTISLVIFIFTKSVVESAVLFTCCKYQSLLNQGTGGCGHSSYEFDKDIFPSEWVVPGAVQAHKTANLVFTLQNRAPWCKCLAKNSIPLTFRRTLSNSTDNTTPREWVLEDFNATFTPHHLTLQGKRYSSGEFCVNRIEEDRNIHPSQEHLFLEIILCHEKCLPSLKIHKLLHLASPHKKFSKIDWSRTSHCEDFENALQSVKKFTKKIKLCPKWTPFFHVHDQFFLISSSHNATFAIQDETYPWASLPPNLYCTPREMTPVESDNMLEEEENTGKIVKFCIPHIKALFYDYQELYAILAGISGLFLLFNLTIYFALRDTLSISGWTELFYSLALYCYFVCSIVGLLIVPEGEDVGSLCYVMSVLIQFFELAISATLVALSFDIFWTFCKFETESYTDDPKVSKLRLILYILFTLLFPLSMITFGVFMNYKSHELGTGTSPPQYGLFHCTSPAWPLSSYVQFLMQGLNLILVMISAYIIINKKNAKERWKGLQVDLEEDHFLDPDRLDIFSKLLIFVFLYWIVGFMEFFFQGEVFTLQWNLIVFHTVNYSQGVFAFLILICNRRSLRGILQGEWSLKKLFHHVCCTCSTTREHGGPEIPEDEVPMSPLMRKMKVGSIRRSTVKENAFY